MLLWEKIIGMHMENLDSYKRMQEEEKHLEQLFDQVGTPITRQIQSFCREAVPQILELAKNDLALKGLDVITRPFLKNSESSYLSNKPYLSNNLYRFHTYKKPGLFSEDDGWVGGPTLIFSYMIGVDGWAYYGALEISGTSTSFVISGLDTILIKEGEGRLQWIRHQEERISHPRHNDAVVDLPITSSLIPILIGKGGRFLAGGYPEFWIPFRTYYNVYFWQGSEDNSKIAKALVGELIGEPLSADYHATPVGLDTRSCFIASAVYGNPNALEVNILREFRDNVLMKHSIGRKFVEVYYSGLGEETADFIKEGLPSAIPLIRKGLDYLIQQYQKHQK